MSDSEQAIDEDLKDDESGQLQNEDDAGLQSLLDEFDTDLEETLPEQDESMLAVDDTEDGFDELLAVPEVDDEMDFTADDVGVQPDTEESGDTTEGIEQAVAESRESSMSDNPLAEVAAIAAERNAEAVKNKGGISGKGIQIALGSVSLLALIVAGFSTWQAYANASRVEELKMALQQRKPAASTGATGDAGALRAELEKVSAQVNEMVATLDGSVLELRENTRVSLEVLTQRLDRLEAVKAEPQAKPEAKRSEAAVSPPVAATPVEDVPSVTKTVSAVGEWSVNLISLSNEKVADEELARLRNLGLRVEKHRVEQDGRAWYRLRVPGFTSRDGAMAYVETVKDKADLNSAWVGKD